MSTTASAWLRPREILAAVAAQSAVGRLLMIHAAIHVEMRKRFS